MTVDFQDHFWGEKQNGFDILYQNLKYGSTSVKELGEFLKSRSFLEEYNVNFLAKLSKKVNNNPQLGTFQPLWLVLKTSTEKLSTVHMQTLQRLNQLMKEINKYCDDHHRKQKQIKNEELSTIEAINELKEIFIALNKAKEFYHSKTVEVERFRRDNSSQKDIEKAEARLNKACSEYKNLIEKYRKVKEEFETKFCISCQNFQKIEEDHINQMKSYLTNYSDILESGQALMGQVHQEFRNNCDEMSTDKLLLNFVNSKGTGSNRPAIIEFEEANPNTINLNQTNASTTLIHDSLMKNSTNSYSSSLDMLNLDLSSGSSPSTTINSNNPLNSVMISNNSSINVNQTMPNSIINMEGENVNDFSANFQRKKDGDNLSENSSSTIDSLDNVSQRSKSKNQKDHHKSFPDIHSNIKSHKWFLRSRKDKYKDRKNSKKRQDSDEEETNNRSISAFKTESNEMAKSDSKDYMIDDEGYTIRPDTTKIKSDRYKDDNFYSSSDSDDSEEEKEKKIFVKINPLNTKNTQNSSSIDQLIASATSLTLVPHIQQHRRNHLGSISSTALNSTHYSDPLRSISTSTMLKLANESKENDLLALLGSNPKQSLNSSDNHADFKETNLFADEVARDSLPKPKAFSLAKIDDRVVTTSSNLTTNSNLSDNRPTIDRYAAFNEIASQQSTPFSSFNQSNELDHKSNQPLNVLPLPPKSSESILQSYNNNNVAWPLTKSVSNASFKTTPTNAFNVYKPQLCKSPITSSASSSKGLMSRAESVISLSSDFNMTPISFSSSRDSSPLTIGMSDTIPLALAFQESIGSCFKGTDEMSSKVHIIGCIKIAFSAGIIQLLTMNPYLPQLSFKLKNTDRLDKIILSKDLIEQIKSEEEFQVYEMNMNLLQASLKRLHEQSPNARYYNLDIIKYQVQSTPGAVNAPLQIVSHWKCDEHTTNLKIDFKYNQLAFKYSPCQSLKNVLFTANIDSNVISMASQPFGKWDSLTKQATWRYNEISQTTENQGLGSIKAKFDISNGPCCPSSVYVQFACQDTSLSGLELELIGTHYRLSLIKKQFSTGRYYCEPKIQKL
ncbi:STE20-related kinase adapter protein alpha [Sarcoptes scabiei]|nr:STE20-related kinase adapter protein alpha [Sarcoptes scabiei]